MSETKRRDERPYVLVALDTCFIPFEKIYMFVLFAHVCLGVQVSTRRWMKSIGQVGDVTDL